LTLRGIPNDFDISQKEMETILPSILDFSEERLLPSIIEAEDVVIEPTATLKEPNKIIQSEYSSTPI
jgi:hypothetical protein